MEPDTPLPTHVAEANASSELAGDGGEAMIAALPVLDAVAKSFRLLTTGPGPLGLGSVELGYPGPVRVIGLDELRRDLPGATRETQDRAWSLLTRSAQEAGAAWVIGAVGVALPMLRATGGWLARGYLGSVEDLDAELLRGFCDALKSLPPETPRLWPRLCYAARNAGAKLRYREARYAARRAGMPESVQPRWPSGHPDLVLADAVRAGVIDGLDAAIIGASRLDLIPVHTIADSLGRTYAQVRYRLEVAEWRLVYWLTGRPSRRVSGNFSGNCSRIAA